jgi:hypothetical protein
MVIGVKSRVPSDEGGVASDKIFSPIIAIAIIGALSFFRAHHRKYHIAEAGLVEIKILSQLSRSFALLEQNEIDSKTDRLNSPRDASGDKG